MKTRGLSIVAAAVVLAGLCWPTNGTAQLRWRISVKFILNASGNRPATGVINTDADVQDKSPTPTRSSAALAGVMNSSSRK